MNDTQNRWWHKYIPSHAANPFSLAAKLITNPKPAARSALFMAGAGLALTPLDYVLQVFEKRKINNVNPPQKPIIVVVGPPRSGTTLVAQFLINTFHVSYFNNLTSLFPRSPITAIKRFGSMAPLRAGDYDAFYGKSRGLSGANDALYIWDRWLGSDRGVVPDALAPGATQSISKFFGAVEQVYKLPMVNKVNRLNTCAHLISEALPNVSFVCLYRNPLNLAQSLYIARREISGSLRAAYGVQHDVTAPDDPVEDVCQQVLFHERHAQEQQERLGIDRFSIISYESFCRNPNGLVEMVARQHPSLEMRKPNSERMESFAISDRRKLPDEIIDRMQQRLKELGAGKVTCQNS